MGYLCLAVALLCGQIKGFCGKKISGTLTGIQEFLAVNLLRMGICTGIGLAVVLLRAGSLAADGYVLLTALLGGTATAVFVVSWLFCVRQGAYMLVSVFLSMGCAVPLVLADLFFGESITLRQWLGLGLLVIAAWLMCSYSNGVKNTKLTPSVLLLLLLCGSSDGIASFSQKWFQMLCAAPQTSLTAACADVSVYNLYVYITAAVVLAACLGILRVRTGSSGRIGKQVFLTKRIFLYVCVMSGCLFGYSYMMVKSAGLLHAAQLYPMSQGLGLILSSVMAGVFFGEKLTGKCVVGMLLTFGALMLINL